MFKQLKEFGLIIDDFEQTDGNSEISQQCLSSYFNIFDRVIISSREEKIINDEGRRKGLEEKGFSLIKADYNQNIEVIKKIIMSKIDEINITQKEEKMILFDKSVMTDELINSIMIRTDFDIKQILERIDQMASYYDWCGGDLKLFNRSIEIYSPEALLKRQKVKKMEKKAVLYF